MGQGCRNGLKVTPFTFVFFVSPFFVESCPYMYGMDSTSKLCYFQLFICEFQP